MGRMALTTGILAHFSEIVIGLQNGDLLGVTVKTKTGFGPVGQRQKGISVITLKILCPGFCHAGTPFMGIVTGVAAEQGLPPLLITPETAERFEGHTNGMIVMDHGGRIPFTIMATQTKDLVGVPLGLGCQIRLVGTVTDRALPVQGVGFPEILLKAFTGDTVIGIEHA